ncbi:oxygenase MpaB family protein [Actinoplanes sp. NPDC051470]|uniref:oxygenase MpaB family protein n=1 Tax=Actinoplanes sp. NPDC051470 TaxID=3157224 RepID=UPI003444E034
MTAEPPGSEPLGPDSLAWLYLSDWRGMLVGLWAGSLQNMHPALGAAVRDHSQFFDERWERLFRSLYPLAGMVYDGPQAARTARQVRDYHLAIKGVDERGRRYHALDPDTFFWAHATFAMVPVVMCRHFGRPLTEPQKEQLYAETLRWYRMYGVSDRPAPADWRGFEAYFDRMCAEVLEDNWATRAVLDLRRIGRPPLLRWLPDAAWSVLRAPMARFVVWLTIGMYPPVVRARLGYRWSRRSALALRMVGGAVAFGWRFVPFEWRYHPRARAAWRRARGSSAPPMETPRRNLPPAGRVRNAPEA